jgi:hypothetical protein
MGGVAIRDYHRSAAAGAQPFGVHPGIFWPRILAAAFSLSATGAFMVLFGVSHPPAGATTLIISLGIISKPSELPGAPAFEFSGGRSFVRVGQAGAAGFELF